MPTSDEDADRVSVATVVPLASAVPLITPEASEWLMLVASGSDGGAASGSGASVCLATFLGFKLCRWSTVPSGSTSLTRKSV